MTDVSRGEKKICKDCRYFVDNRSSYASYCDDWMRCFHPRFGRNLVTGCAVSRPASEERKIDNDANACGPDGVFFEPSIEPSIRREKRFWERVFCK